MISTQLLNIRKQRNMTMKDVAAGIGVSLSAYQKYENGTCDVSTSTLRKLADFHGVTADHLLGRDTGEPDPLDRLAFEFNMTSLEKKILDNYLSLPEHMRGELMDFLHKSVLEVQAEE